jgi:hypothetical protein
MDGDIETIPDLKYREFMLKLSRQITDQDMAELKYMLTSLIPDGRKETLDTILELFRFLEQQLFIGPNNLGNLQELFRLMDKQRLYEMVRNFILGKDSQIAVEFIRAESGALRMRKRRIKDGNRLTH